MRPRVTETFDHFHAADCLCFACEALDQVMAAGEIAQTRHGDSCGPCCSQGSTAPTQRKLVTESSFANRLGMVRSLATKVTHDGCSGSRRSASLTAR